MICPHCGVFVQFHLTGASITGIRHSIVRCTNCDERTYVILKVTNGTHEVIDYYPKRIPQIDKSFPNDVRDDYIEAIRCFEVNAYKACVVMCRRSLQASALEKGANKSRLVDQLEELMDNGIITQSLYEWTTEIRHEGNIGAHPDKDGLKYVTKDDAQAILHFVEEYLKHVYEMPARVAEKRAKRTKNP